MVKIDENNSKWIITFKKKNRRPNKTDDKFELFRNVVGLHDTSDILDLIKFKGHRMADPIRKNKTTVTDINRYETPVIIARLSEEQAIRIRKDPNVEDVIKEFRVYPQAETLPWGIDKVRAPESWTISTSKGSGANVAIIDDGMYSNHPDLKANVKINQVFIDGDTKTTPPGGNFHGTHVAGTVAAVSNDIGVVGVAPSTSLWNLKVIGPNGASGPDILEANVYAKENSANVVNMSLGSLRTTPVDQNDIFGQLFREMFNLNIVICCAAGNDGKRDWNGHFPSNYSGCFEVSAFGEDNLLASFSNMGPHTDFTAPGVGITSTGKDISYATLNGTSMATPHLAGLCALAFASYKDDGCNPVYQPDGTKKSSVIERVLKLACNKLGRFTAPRVNAYGFGMPEADKIVKILMGIQV